LNIWKRLVCTVGLEFVFELFDVIVPVFLSISQDLFVYLLRMLFFGYLPILFLPFPALFFDKHSSTYSYFSKELSDNFSVSDPYDSSSTYSEYSGSRISF